MVKTDVAGVVDYALEAAVSPNDRSDPPSKKKKRGGETVSTEKRFSGLCRNYIPSVNWRFKVLAFEHRGGCFPGHVYKHACHVVATSAQPQHPSRRNSLSDVEAAGCFVALVTGGCARGLGPSLQDLAGSCWRAADDLNALPANASGDVLRAVSRSAALHRTLAQPRSFFFVLPSWPAFLF